MCVIERTEDIIEINLLPQQHLELLDDEVQQYLLLKSYAYKYRCHFFPIKKPRQWQQIRSAGECSSMAGSLGSEVVLCPK